MDVQDVIGVALPRIAAPFIQGAIWRMPSDGCDLYLTFDDGPSIEYSRDLASLLSSRNCSATFFMTGRQVEAHPEIVHEIHDLGHALGLHGFDHLDGWQARTRTLLHDFERAMDVFRSLLPDASLLYRPPHGHLRRSISDAVSRAGGHVVMWDLLAGDYKPASDPDAISRRVCRYVRPGSIVVLHDGPASGGRALRATHNILDALQPEGWRFHPIHTHLVKS